MNKITSTLLAIALAASAGWAADPPEKKEVPLPPAVVNAENAALAAADKARMVYVKTVEAEVKKLQAMLEKEKAAATRAGNLELALAIKAKQESITIDSVVKKLSENNDPLDILGDVERMKVMETLCAGEWIHLGRYDYSFSKNKTMSALGGSRTGTFEISGDAKSVVITWDSGKVKSETIVIDNGSYRLSGGIFERKK
jgi:hypothetical protein